ncbi:hypothetical protein BBC0178_017750 [Bartonella apihabitans]|uniref:Uncharacterized protein n=1 Tax=Bartonella apihabitans TaxID=2750929 RepID=A0A1U9MD72_9HYPH|nr:hypothetical protein [Bartonella apihabitans]AQT43227.1 hypothetical protein BBC0178_017750 [Bartonella apihabitans]
MLLFFFNALLKPRFPPSRIFKKPVILKETKKMTRAYSIDTPSSDDTDWILLDFDEPDAESRKVRDKKTTPLSRKPAKKRE